MSQSISGERFPLNLLRLFRRNWNKLASVCFMFSEASLLVGFELSQVGSRCFFSVILQSLFTWACALTFTFSTGRADLPWEHWGKCAYWQNGSLFYDPSGALTLIPFLSFFLTLRAIVSASSLAIDSWLHFSEVLRPWTFWHGLIEM